MTSLRTALIATLAIATTVSLSACTSDESAGMSGMDGMNGRDGASESSSATSTDSDFNNQDRMFVMMMKPHHEQAVEMVDVMLEKDGISDEVTALATQIKAAQVPEIEQFDEWIDAWGDSESMPGMDHSMNGMMSDEDMSALDSATGTEAERVFLEQMIEHHEGAIDMAQDEIDDGRNADVLEMAGNIVTSQTEEIATMNDLLATR